MPEMSGLLKLERGRGRGETKPSSAAGEGPRQGQLSRLRSQDGDRRGKLDPVRRPFTRRRAGPELEQVGGRPGPILALLEDLENFLRLA